MENRHENRYTAWEPVILCVGTGQLERQREAHLIDISKSGLQVVADLKIEAGTSVHIALGHLSIEGVVKHCESGGDGLYTLGAEITSLELNGANRAEAQAASRSKQRPLTTNPAFAH